MCRAWISRARVSEPSGSGLFGLLDLKIGLEAFKIWTLIMDLKICQILQKLLQICPNFLKDSSGLMA
jgi:hypothetical protein